MFEISKYFSSSFSKLKLNGRLKRFVHSKGLLGFILVYLREGITGKVISFLIMDMCKLKSVLRKLNDTFFVVITRIRNTLMNIWSLRKKTFIYYFTLTTLH